MSLPFMRSKDAITVNVHGELLTITSDAPNFDAVNKAIDEHRWSDVAAQMNTAKAVEHWTEGRFKVSRGQVTFDGESIPESLAKRILAIWEQKGDYTYLLRFYERLALNPSWRSVQQLYNFMSHAHLPIGPDGCIYGYKSVRQDWMDHHTGKHRNKPGDERSMPRNKISDDPRAACASGYHVGDFSYASTFRNDGKMVIIRVDPADVVSVPYDSSQRKMRVCRYFVLREALPGEKLPDGVWDPDAKSKQPEVKPTEPKRPQGYGLYVDNYPLDNHDAVITAIKKIALQTEDNEQIERILAGTEPLATGISRDDAVRYTEELVSAEVEVIVVPKIPRLKVRPDPVPAPPGEKVSDAALLQEAAQKPAAEPMVLTATTSREEQKAAWEKMSSHQLRWVARNDLKVRGANKIKGGKEALIEKMLEKKFGHKVDVPEEGIRSPEPVEQEAPVPVVSSDAPCRDLREKHWNTWNAMNVNDLRKEATKMGVHRASKIKGGKPALLEVMLDKLYGPAAAEEPAEKPEEVVLETPAEEIAYIAGVEVKVAERHMELSQMNMGDLRKYALHEVGIPKASKLKGGKTALIRAIIQKEREESGG
jgi:hypothetical protein